jgi:hypothetical protein
MNNLIGNYYTEIICESFVDKETGRIRVRPLKDQILPSNLVIECLKSIRESYPIGTLFTAENVKVCKKPDGRIYLRAKDQIIKKLEV